MNVRYTAMVLISSPNAENKQNNQTFPLCLASPYFTPYDIILVCKKCLPLGVTDICVHCQDDAPPWINGENGMVKSLYNGDDESFARENLGTNIVSDKTCFAKASVSKFLSKPRVKLHQRERFVFIVADPCAGSNVVEKNLSDFCIVGMTTSMKFVCIDAFRAVVTEDYSSKLINVLHQLRSMDHLMNCTFVVDAESGTGFCAGDIEHIIATNFKNVVFMSDFNNKPGTFTSNPAKQEMMELTRSALDSGDLDIVDEIATTHRNQVALMAEVQRQLLGYERVIKPSVSEFTTSKIRYSGKGANKTDKDDLSVTIQRAVRAKKVFFSDPKYRKYYLAI